MGNERLSAEERDFYIACFEQECEDVRHDERMENTSIQWFLLIVGGVLAFIFSGSSTLAARFENLIYALPLGFLVLYAAVLNLLLLELKKRKDIHHKRISQTEEVILGPPKKKVSTFILYVFTLRFNLVVLIGCGCVFLFVFNLISGLSGKGLTIWGAFISSIMALAYLYVMRILLRRQPGYPQGKKSKKRKR